MINEEVEQIIRSSEDKLRFQLKLESFALWILTSFFLVFGSIAQYFIAWYAGLLISAGIVFFAWALIATSQSRRRLTEFEQIETKTLELWQDISKSRVFGWPIRGAALEVRKQIEEIYSTDDGAVLLPLSHAIRLFDVHMRQMKRLKPVNSRLIHLYSLRQPLVVKTAQLQTLGKDYTKSQKEEWLDSEIDALEGIRFEVESSCRRLEKLVEQIGQEAQSRQLHRELDELTAQLPHSTQSFEPSFAPESLQDLERQIGREIERYLQLERETEEHLR
ncbi:MAG: hypothetical protein KY445_07945 [Armatimonadetes bacterium]|nr:hypothetical protein [Armatimonadota bacterium]